MLGVVLRRRPKISTLGRVFRGVVPGEGKTGWPNPTQRRRSLLVRPSLGPLRMNANNSPANETEANTLRAYIPTETLREIDRLSKLDSADAEKRRKNFIEANAQIDAAKERMRKERILIKKAEQIRKAYFMSPLFARVDAARDAAWAAARAARDAAIATGEVPKIETLEQCNKRVKEGA